MTFDETKGAPLLEIENLSLAFEQYTVGLRRRHLKVLHELSLTVNRGEILAMVGASGSGKSLLAHAILGILPDNADISGTLKYQQEVLTSERQAALRGREIAFIPQGVDYLDPVMKVGKQIQGVRGDATHMRDLLEKAGLGAEVEHLYPFELSGGMARRVLVATALMEDAQLIVADEPTPGMTHAMAVAALQAFREMADAGKAVLLITHELDLAYDVADRIAVLYAGSVVENASAHEFRDGPDQLRHPYSKALWAALPQNGFVPIPGTQPYAENLPKGCSYAPRCPWRTDDCTTAEVIPEVTVRGGKVRCIHAS